MICASSRSNTDSLFGRLLGSFLLRLVSLRMVAIAVLMMAIALLSAPRGASSHHYHHHAGTVFFFDNQWNGGDADGHGDQPLGCHHRSGDLLQCLGHLLRQLRHHRHGAIDLGGNGDHQTGSGDWEPQLQGCLPRDHLERHQHLIDANPHRNGATLSDLDDDLFFRLGG